MLPVPAGAGSVLRDKAAVRCATAPAPGSRIGEQQSSGSGSQGLMQRPWRGAQDAYLEICRCYKAIAAMPSVVADAERAADVLRKICWFVVLAPTSSDQARARRRGRSPAAYGIVCGGAHQQRSGLACGTQQ